MAIPVLAGIPWLAGIIGTAFSAIFTYLITIFTKRFAIGLAAVAVMVALAAAFFLAITGIINGLSYSMPAEISQAAGMVLPSNTTACITAVVTAHVLRYAYDWNMSITKAKLMGV